MGFGESLDEFQHVTANRRAADSVVRLRECKIVLVRQQFSRLRCLFGGLLSVSPLPMYSALLILRDAIATR